MYVEKLDRLIRETVAAIDECGHLPAPSKVIELCAEITRLRDAYYQTCHEVESTLAPALGYEHDDEFGYVIGDHVPASLASEAASAIKRYRAALDFYRTEWTANPFGPFFGPAKQATVMLLHDGGNRAGEALGPKHPDDMRLEARLRRAEDSLQSTANELVLTKAERDKQDKFITSQANIIIEQSEEIERLRVELAEANVKASTPLVVLSVGEAPRMIERPDLSEQRESWGRSCVGKPGDRQAIPILLKGESTQPGGDD